MEHTDTQTVAKVLKPNFLSLTNECRLAMTSVLFLFTGANHAILSPVLSCTGVEIRKKDECSVKFTREPFIFTAHA
jgi:hypothetical protein